MLNQLKKYFEKFKDEWVFACLFVDLHSDSSFRKKELYIIYISIIIVILCYLIKEFFRYKYNYSFGEFRQDPYYLKLILVQGFFSLIPWLLVLKQTIRSLISIRKASKLLSKEMERIQQQKSDIKIEIAKLKNFKKI